ncbi:protein of unknown function [Shewanella benthica]|uniref:Uncharacterized protein n=1 Tax=Shewanella benthica TaxID=43661 RepID=A0A330M6S2_9GAMM|nr:protein of unknown function [Shewanella benthica]
MNLMGIARVHCRTGSLEIVRIPLRLHSVVHCRTGSLENNFIKSILNYMVHCRTGSLEIPQFQLH